MKPLIRTIAVFVTLTLATGNSALAMKESEEQMGEVGVMEMKMESMQREAERAQRLAERVQRRAERELHVQPILPSLDSIAGTGKYSGVGTVLVIPAAETQVGELATIMEDMNIMSRIFDKELRETNMILRGGFSRRIRDVFTWDSQGVEGIYLDGYGVLFLMKVDFPLLPPAEAPEKEEAQEDVDLVWEETRREIYEPEDVRRARRRRSKSDRSEEKYDADKVKELKRILIKELKHATNIRALKPNEWVILTLTGSRQSGGGIASTVGMMTRQILVTDKDQKTMKIYEEPLSGKMGFSSRTVLTIRVKKSDTDAFANGEVDFDQYRQRVQIFAY